MNVQHIVTTRNVESSLCDNVISLGGENYFCQDSWEKKTFSSFGKNLPTLHPILKAFI